MLFLTHLFDGTTVTGSTGQVSFHDRHPRWGVDVTGGIIPRPTHTRESLHRGEETW